MRRNNRKMVYLGSFCGTIFTGSKAKTPPPDFSLVVAPSGRRWRSTKRICVPTAYPRLTLTKRVTCLRKGRWVSVLLRPSLISYNIVIRKEGQWLNLLFPITRTRKIKFHFFLNEAQTSNNHAHIPHLQAVILRGWKGKSVVVGSVVINLLPCLFLEVDIYCLVFCNHNCIWHVNINFTRRS